MSFRHNNDAQHINNRYTSDDGLTQSSRTKVRDTKEGSNDSQEHDDNNYATMICPPSKKKAHMGWLEAEGKPFKTIDHSNDEEKLRSNKGCDPLDLSD
jgi:hypothetical protein